jgi:hypothetical protein
MGSVDTEIDRHVVRGVGDDEALGDVAGALEDDLFGKPKGRRAEGGRVSA